MSAEFDYVDLEIIVQKAGKDEFHVRAKSPSQEEETTVAIDAGLNTESVLLASVNPELSGYGPSEIANFYHQLEERLRDLPGVRAAATPRRPGAVQRVLAASPRPAVRSSHAAERLRRRWWRRRAAAEELDSRLEA